MSGAHTDSLKWNMFMTGRNFEGSWQAVITEARPIKNSRNNMPNPIPMAKASCEWLFKSA